MPPICPYPAPMRSAWRKRENRRLRDRESFLRGYVSAINSLMPATFHRPGLVLSAQQYIEGVILAGRHGVKIKTVGATSKKKISDSAYFSGYREGERGGIRNAIRGTDQMNLPMS